MANAAAKESVVAAKLLAVSLPRPVSLAGAPVQHFTAGKYDITKDERGDVTIRDRHSGRALFVPKQLAILEIEGV